MYEIIRQHLTQPKPKKAAATHNSCSFILKIPFLFPFASFMKDKNEIEMYNNGLVAIGTRTTKNRMKNFWISSFDFLIFCLFLPMTFEWVTMREILLLHWKLVTRRVKFDDYEFSAVIQVFVRLRDRNFEFQILQCRCGNQKFHLDHTKNSEKSKSAVYDFLIKSNCPWA